MALDLLTPAQVQEVLRDIRTTIAIAGIYPKEMTIGELLEILKKQEKTEIKFYQIPKNRA